MKSVMAGNTIRQQDTVVLVACGTQPAAAHPSRARHLAWFASGARLKIVRGQNTSDALDFSAYQLAAAPTGALRAADNLIVYPTLGLANEAGEVAGKVACGAIGDGTGRSTAGSNPTPATSKTQLKQSTRDHP